MEKIPLSTINPIIIKISSIKNIKVFSVGKYNGMFNESERAGKVLNRFNEKSQTNQDYFYECLCQFTCRGRGCLPEYIHAGAYGRANPYMVHCVFGFP